MTTLSAKNQITLPARLLRGLGLKPGDRMAVSLEGNRLILRPRPKDWLAYHAGSLPDLYGKDREEIDAYVRELREGDERDAEIEGAWTSGRRR